MVNRALLQGIVALVGVALLATGLAGAAGVVPYSLTASTTPKLAVQLNGTAGATAMQLVLAMHIQALPKGEMNLTKVVANYGDGTTSTYYPTNPITGWFTMYRHHNYTADGTYAVHVTVHARIGTGNTSTAYSAAAAPISVVVPLSTNPGCSSTACASVTSMFSWSANGLTVSFTDESIAENATVSYIAWDTGDGYCDLNGVGPCTAKSSFTHTYTNAGTYLVTEYVEATPAGSSNAVNSTSQQNITISVGTSPGGGTGGSAPSGSFNVLTGALIGLGIGVIAAAALWKPEWAALAVITGLALGGAAGWLFAAGVL